MIDWDCIKFKRVAVGVSWIERVLILKKWPFVSLLVRSCVVPFGVVTMFWDEERQWTIPSEAVPVVFICLTDRLAITLSMFLSPSSKHMWLCTVHAWPKQLLVFASYFQCITTTFGWMHLFFSRLYVRNGPCLQGRLATCRQSSSLFWVALVLCLGDLSTLILPNFARKSYKVCLYVLLWLPCPSNSTENLLMNNFFESCTQTHTYAHTHTHTYTGEERTINMTYHLVHVKFGYGFVTTTRENERGQKNQKQITGKT